MRKLYNKYLIGPDEQFDPARYSSVNEEIGLIKEKTLSLPSFFKAAIIISFLKDHSLQNDWIKSNPELTELIISGSLFTGSIESLFESCKTNYSFRNDLESYLREKF